MTIKNPRVLQGVGLASGLRRPVLSSDHPARRSRPACLQLLWGSPVPRAQSQSPGRRGHRPPSRLVVLLGVRPAGPGGPGEGRKAVRSWADGGGALGLGGEPRAPPRGPWLAIGQEGPAGSVLGWPAAPGLGAGLEGGGVGGVGESCAGGAGAAAPGTCVAGGQQAWPWPVPALRCPEPFPGTGKPFPSTWGLGSPGRVSPTAPPSAVAGPVSCRGPGITCVPHVALRWGTVVTPSVTPSLVLRAPCGCGGLWRVQPGSPRRGWQLCRALASRWAC